MMEMTKKPTIREWLKAQNIPIRRIAEYMHRDVGYVCGIFNGTQALGIDVFRDLPTPIRFECSFEETRYSNELGHLIMSARMRQIQYILNNVNNNYISEKDLCKINAIIDGYYDGELEI